MKKYFPLLVLMLFVANGKTNAKRISEADALGIVERLQAKKGNAPNALRSGGMSVAGNTDGNYYVVNDHANGGYYFVSASDRMGDMVLGHAENGEYDEEAINRIPALRALLSSFSRQIEELESKPTALRSWLEPGSTCFGEDIKPFIKTQWDQGYPFNLQAPDSAATGCVATAMAQVMKYYNHPSSTSQTIPSYESYGTAMDPLPKASFDYKLMLDRYDTLKGGESDPEESRLEVAKLMEYCGRAVEMQYADESGARLTKACEKLKSVFGYSNKTRYLSNIVWLGNITPDRLFTEETWGQTLYNELAHGRPIIMGSYDANYSGQGHAYVCCGYAWGEGFYYNWGWNGYGDGYYQRPSRFPEMGSHGYFYDEAIIGIEPSKPRRINGCDLEVSDMVIKSSYVRYDLSTIELKLKNVGENVFSDYFTLSSNEFINEIASKPVTLNSGEEGVVRFDYSIMGLGSHLTLEIVSADGLLVADSTIELGKYNHDYSKLVCEILEDKGERMEVVNNNVADGVDRFPKLHGDRRRPLYVRFTNHSDTTFRDMMETRLLMHDSTYVDTLILNDETFMEIPPQGYFETYVYLRSRVLEDFCPIGRLIVGNPLHTVANFYFQDCYEIAYTDIEGQRLSLASNSCRIPLEAAFVDLRELCLDSLDLTEANPNCLFYCQSRSHAPCNLGRNIVAGDSSEFISITATNSFRSFSPIFADSAEFSIDFDPAGDGYLYKVLYLPFKPQLAYLSDGGEVLKSGDLEISELSGFDTDGNVTFVSTDVVEENRVYLLKAPAPKARGLNSVRFVATDVLIPPSRDTLVELRKSDPFESNAVLASSTEGPVFSKSDYMVSYSFDPTSMSFKLGDGLFSDLHPFEGYLVDRLGFSDDYAVIVTADIEDLTADDERMVDVFLPSGLFYGTFLMRNGYIENLPEGIYVSCGAKHIRKAR